MCNFEIEEYEAVFDRIFYNEFLKDEKKDPSLDIRTRLSISVEGGNTLRKVYKGGQLQNFEEI
jgi:hypothetical protein